MRIGWIETAAGRRSFWPSEIGVRVDLMPIVRAGDASEHHKPAAILLLEGMPLSASYLKEIPKALKGHACLRMSMYWAKRH